MGKIKFWISRTKYMGKIKFWINWTKIYGQN